MIITPNHRISSDIDNKTRNRIQFNNAYLNSSDISQEYQPIWVSLSLICIIIFTIGGNSLVCIAVIRERHLQNTTNYFLTSLAFTDCLVACLVMPIAAVVEFIGYFPFDSLICNIWLTFDVCCCTSSIWHMSVMSLNRYLTLRYPLKYGRNKRRSLVAYKIIIIWSISFAICLPLFVLGLIDTSNVYDQITRSCFAAHRTFKIYGSFVAFFIPLIIMIVTYALTMTALQQAHTTKRRRSKRQKKIRAVVNLATMAIRWKRAVNTVEISDEKTSATVPQLEIQSSEKKISIDYQRKRASSLLPIEQPKKSTFISTQRLNESSEEAAAASMNTDINGEKQLKSLPETSIEQSSDQHLAPNAPTNSQAKRSHSCTPLLDVENGRKNRRRSSSVHALLQIRRDSAKISEELANLTAQLSVSMNNNNSTSKRSSLSVPNSYEPGDNETPTIAQLLAETSVNQPIIIPTSFLTVNPKRRRRSNSADIRLPTLQLNDNKTSMINLPVPNLRFTNESIQNIPSNNPEQSTHYTRFDTAYQRVKDWITVTSSATNLHNDHNTKISPRFVSAINVNEHTPILTGNKRDLPQLTNLKRQFPRIEQLYGQTSASNAGFRPPQQHLLVNDQVASAQNFADRKRSSVCSLTSSVLATRLSRNNRPSTSSSLASSSQKGTIRRGRPRLTDILSQLSFQMVSLDTDDTSSCTSSLNHHSPTIKSARAGTSSPPKCIGRTKRQRFKSIAKSSATNEHKAMRVLLIIFSIFIILWTPFFVINLVSCFITDIPSMLMSIATWLGYCSSAANPIIYTIFSRSFRQAFINILTCRKTVHTHRSSHIFTPSCHSMSMSAGRKFSALSKATIDLR